jgi:proteasome lid subunit RPN8/RPN11
MVNISAILLSQIFVYCEQKLPYEACGAFFGAAARNDVIIHSFLPISNVSTDPLQHFVFDRNQLVTLLYNSQKNTDAWIGIFHSHPNTAAYPSAEDLQSAWKLPIYCIISLENRVHPIIKAFSIVDQQKRPVSVKELAIEITVDYARLPKCE